MLGFVLGVLISFVVIEEYMKFRARRVSIFSLDQTLTGKEIEEMMKKFWVWPLDKFKRR